MGEGIRKVGAERGKRRMKDWCEGNRRQGAKDTGKRRGEQRERTIGSEQNARRKNRTGDVPFTSSTLQTATLQTTTLNKGEPICSWASSLIKQAHIPTMTALQTNELLLRTFLHSTLLFIFVSILGCSPLLGSVLRCDRRRLTGGGRVGLFGWSGWFGSLGA